MLKDSDVAHIAKLARIELKPGEAESYKRDLSSILGYVDQLQKIDTTSVEPLYQTTGLENSVRPDESKGHFRMDAKLDALLIKQAPMSQERFIKVKSVLKK